MKAATIQHHLQIQGEFHMLHNTNIQTLESSRVLGTSKFQYPDPQKVHALPKRWSLHLATGRKTHQEGSTLIQIPI